MKEDTDCTIFSFLMRITNCIFLEIEALIDEMDKPYKFSIKDNFNVHWVSYYFEWPKTTVTTFSNVKHLLACFKHINYVNRLLSKIIILKNSF